MGQPEELEGFDLVWKGTIEGRESYTREIRTSLARRYTVWDYLANESYQMKGEYRSIDPLIEDGEFLFFHWNGQLSHKGSYKDGELVGDWLIYNEAGELIRTINYDFEVNETARPDHESEDCDRMAEFIGKDYSVETDKAVDLHDFLAAEIVYPPMAAKYNIQGKVYVQFMINEDGSVSDALVVRTLHKDLDKEALRVVRNMPAWKPAVKEGKPVRTAYTCPIAFSMED
jgi:TonB family protein